MENFRSKCSCINHLDMYIISILLMSVVSIKQFMVSNKLLELGSTSLVALYLPGFLVLPPFFFFFFLPHRYRHTHHSHLCWWHIGHKKLCNSDSFLHLSSKLRLCSKRSWSHHLFSWHQGSPELHLSSSQSNKIQTWSIKKNSHNCSEVCTYTRFLRKTVFLLIWWSTALWFISL